MFKLRNFKIVCTKWPSNLMPNTGLKIVGTGACLPSCSISSSFQNSLKTFGHRVYEFLECCNLVPFLPDIGFQLLSSLTYFLFYDAPNILYRWKLWTAGTLLLWSHAVVIAAVCGFALSFWNTCHLEGSICCSQTFIYRPAFKMPSKTCKLPIPYALINPMNSYNTIVFHVHCILKTFDNT